jgi:isopenicillin N synthase-like dioxygenase
MTASTQSTSTSTRSSSIPVIDIGPYLDGSDKQGVAVLVGQACQEIGFFMISGHGIDLSLLKAVQSVSTDFFDQSLAQKQKCQAPFGLGYMGEGTENVAATLEDDDNKSNRKDLKESLNLTLPVRDEVWPADCDDLNIRKVCQTYYEAVEHLANQLMRLFALALDLDECFFDTKVDQAYTTLRLLNYPAQDILAPADRETAQQDAATTELQTRNAEHTDYGTLTILWSPDSRGLQAQSRQDESQWIDVVSPPENFIINIGDLMMNWTNDEWVSTLHRVVPHPDTLGQRRMSVPFFHNPNPDAIIECIASCHSDTNPPKYKPMLAKTHLEMKVSKALGQEETMVG